MSQGIAARNSILAPVLVNQAMDQATSGFHAQAQGVIEDLQGLVPPSAITQAQGLMYPGE